MLSVLACVQMGIYKSFNGLGILGEYVTLTAGYSFGNMGFTGTACGKMPIDWEHMDYVNLTFTCQETTHITDVLSSGMMLDRAFPGGMFDAVHDCYIDPNDKRQETFEMVQFRKKNFDSIVMSECEGLSKCQVQLPFSSFARV